METAEPQTDQLRGVTSNRATRAASLGVAGVVVCLAAFSIFASYATQTQVDRARLSASLLRNYEHATMAIRAAEASELEYLIEPSPEHRVELSESNQAINAAVSEVAARGGKDDARLATDILALHDQYLVASARLVAAMAAGDEVEARRIDEDEGDPFVHAMDDQITAATNGRAADAEAAFVALQNTARWILIESPVVFAIGFGLLFGLWRILEQSHRAARETYREIEQLSRLRSEFVSIVSHEFRTPLTGIQGFSEMMRDEDMTMPQVREYAGDINKDARRLARLITDMLDLDRMESGRMTLNSEPVDLNLIVAETAAQFRLSAADHPIELELDSRLPMLMGDSDRLTQVVTNLVSNAIKYSPSGGAVELRTKRTERTVTLTVRDHGMGIEPDQLEKIFERYSRVQTTETRAISGTGLGLPIVRLIVQLCDGKVWATSEAGQGSVLHVQLPLREAAVAAPLAA
ncbi:MAG: HAMP domain-containing sensor histidine kinase [Chloroflexota bacterium]